MNVGCAASLSVWDTFRLVTPVSLAVVSLAAVALVAAAVVVLGGDVFRSLAPDHRAPGARPSWRRPALALTALFLVVFSAKLLLMRGTPVTAPFWDQWDGEAATLVLPVQHCQLDWPMMLQLHNEHRIFFTRLLALDLMMVNGQWDPRLEQVADAAIHALVAVIVGAVFWVSTGRRRLYLTVLVCAAIFALPFGWENTLVGFQSPFYFQLLFSLLALWLTTTHRAGAGGWWLGWSCAVCGIFTAAGGVLMPGVIVGLVALQLAGDRRAWRGALLNGLIALPVCLLGFIAAAPPLREHAYLKAASAGDFATTLGRALAWPWLLHPWLSLVMWLPLAVLLLAILQRRGRTTAEERLIVGFGAWVLLQAAALAYGRGVNGTVPVSRYMDFLSLGCVANLMALIAAPDWQRTSGEPTPAKLIAVSAWLLLALVGADQLMAATFGDLGVWRPYFVAQARSVRSFVATDDLAAFTAKRPLEQLPYPDPVRLATLLRDPDIRRVLPAAVREPIRVEPQTTATPAFVIDGSPVRGQDPLPRIWGSYGIDGRATEGRFESQPMPPCGGAGRLQFQVSGYLGVPRHSLTIRDLASGREVAVRPADVAREGWAQIVIPCPAGRFAIVAVDANPDSWFAFREPVEIARGSVMSEWLIARSRRLLVIALGLAGLALWPNALRGHAAVRTVGAPL